MAETGPPLVIEAAFPKKFRPLLGRKARYKIFYGGRGSAKSWQFARALLIRGIKEPGLRVLCAREVQSSMKDSVHKLLVDQIEKLGLGAYYRVLESEIRGPKGTLFTFKGLSDPNALKSTEGVDVCWLEEANTVTKASWNKLDPTIRKAGSEIWVSFNPELMTDYLYDLFVKKAPPPGSIVVKVTWRDNPWFPEELKAQRDHMRETDYDEYLHVWEGNCRIALDGAVYARELRLAQKQDRITKVPIDPAKPVHTFWDLGKGDMTAIWFVQIVGLQYRIVHYLQANGLEVGDYVRQLEELKVERGWYYGTMWLPHDAEHQRLGMPRTIKAQVQEAGYRVRITPKISIADGVASARAIFAACWFDEEHTADGINCLRQYHYDVDDDGTRSKLPVHDWSSHGADGFRYLGVALKDDAAPAKHKPKTRPRVPPGRNSWMAR